MISFKEFIKIEEEPADNIVECDSHTHVATFVDKKGNLVNKVSYEAKSDKHAIKKAKERKELLKMMFHKKAKIKLAGIEKHIKEDGVGGGAVAAPGPTNVVGGGAIAGTGGKGGEPGVNRKKKLTPVIMGMGHRKSPK